MQLKAALAVAGLLLLVAVSVWYLEEPYKDWIWVTQFEGFTTVLPTTAWAAFKTWTFWAFATALVGLALLKIDPKIGYCDAILGGAAGVWVFAYIAGNLLGPIGLFNSWTIWLILIAAFVSIARNPPKVEFRVPSYGQRMALLACALMAVSTVPLELGSPVPPYMDAPNVPAAVQRILTFGVYLPLDNDPYGHWSPTAQTPGVDLLYAFLALGARVHLGVLAVTATMVPMAGLIILATYRLGRAVADDSAGGLASLLLFADTLVMRAQIGRGTPVAFAMIALGLAFFVDPERRPLRTGVGAAALGGAVACHAIEGGFAFATAATVVLVRFLEDNWGSVLHEAACLIGGVCIAVPEFAVALQVKLPYLLLPGAQIVGLGIIFLAARSLPLRPREVNLLATWSERILVLAGFLLLAQQASGLAYAMRIYVPQLLVLSLIGLLVALVSGREASGGIYVVALALLVAKLAERLVNSIFFGVQGAQAGFGGEDVIFKIIEFWGPYFLVFPAAVSFDWLFRNVSKWMAIAAALAFVIFPWRQDTQTDLFYYEHPLVVEWAKNLYCAKIGWWGALPDHRWVQGPSEMGLTETLRSEIRAGRITSQTHIVRVTPEALIFDDPLLFSVYTGIDDDVYVAHPDRDLATGGYAGSRMRPTNKLLATLAKRPPYIVVQNDPPTWMSLPPRGYDEIFHRNRIRLFRRDDLSPKVP